MTVQTIDIETVPSAKALDLEPPEHWLNKGVSSNWKSDTVEALRTKRAAEWPEELLKRASLDWRLGQICCASLCVEGDCWTSTSELGGEGDLLREFWDHIRLMHGRRTAGFNIRNFDLPWILGRTAVQCLTPTRRWRTNRYDPRDLTDWSDILSNYGAFDMRGWTLERYAEWFGLEHRPVGSGADVAGWVAAGEWAKVAGHCESDALATWELDRMMAPGFLGAP